MNFLDHHQFIRQINQDLETLRRQAQLEQHLPKAPKIKPAWRLTQLFAPKPIPQPKQRTTSEGLPCN